MDPKNKIGRLGVVVAAVAAVVLMVASAGALVAYAWLVIDRTQATEETRLLRRSMDALTDRLEKEVTTAAEWDVAYDAIAARDVPALKRAVADYYAHSFGHDITLFIDPRGVPIYGRSAGRLMSTVELERFTKALLPAVRAVQDGELERRATLDRRNPGDSSLAARAGAMRVAGATYLMGVASVVPDTRYLDGREPTAVVASGRLIDGNFAFELEHTLGLKGIHVSPRILRTGAAGAIGLKDFSGREIATLAWAPKRPAAAAARAVAQPASAILLTLLVSWAVVAHLILRLLSTLAARDRALMQSVEELSAARDAAQAASHFKSQFIANVSHEIRTPLNGVLGMAQVMSMGELDEVQRGRLAVIQRSGDGLIELLNDVLDLAKIEASEFDVVAAPFDLEDLITEVMSTFEALAQTKGIAFQVQVSASAAGAYVSDAAGIRQILHNLLGNALKFTREGSVTLSAAYGHGSLTLSVKDTGPGIPPERLARLFDKYEQADDSIARRHAGVSLGLPISDGLARALGGRLEVESRLGEGSVFRLSLPLVRKSATAREQTLAGAATARSSASGLRVLVVEDNAVNQLVVTALLEQAEVRAEVVANGLQAVEACRERQFDLVLMDIQMPVMDGVEATRQIRAQERQDGRPPVPIIALTANAHSSQRDAYAAAGLDGCLAKPINYAELLEALQRIADGPSEPAIPG